VCAHRIENPAERMRIQDRDSGVRETAWHDPSWPLGATPREHCLAVPRAGAAEVSPGWVGSSRTRSRGGQSRPARG
jgi:hypothetical protein